MAIEKDKGYAWIVVLASSFLMFIGPSTYTSYGLLFMEVDLRSYHNWIINSMCSLWFFTAILAGPMAAVSTHRKIAMIGCFMATCGFLMASATLDNPVWLFLSFSLFVGVGLGLAINVTFLLVAAHFERYRGLANGIGQISVSVAHLTTPFLYSIIEGPKDKLHIRALLTAVAFLSATFYMDPFPKSRPMSPKLSNGSSTQRQSDNLDQLAACDSFEDIPLVELKDEHSSSKNSTSHQKPRRRSQYLVAISATLLPKIPEESENNSLSEISATIESSPSSPSVVISNRTFVENQTHYQINNNVDLEENSLEGNPNGTNVPICVHPAAYQANRTNKKAATPRIQNGHGQRRNSSLSKRVYKIRATRAATRYKRDKEIEFVEDEGENENCTSRISRFQILKFGQDVFFQMDFNFFTNLKFLNMALGSAITLITFPSFSVILCSYISLVSLKGKEEQKDTALLIILLLDMFSRLIFSYISDFPFFNRRIGFFCATVCATVTIICIGFVTDMNIIYCMCAVYGICMGILITTESLMFVDIFGIEKLTSTYGIVNLFKCIGLLVATPLVSPASAFVYTTHPFSYILKNNSTACHDCDPLDLYQYEADDHTAIEKRQNMLCVVAAPGILCSLLWTVEAMWIRTGKKPHRLQRSAFSENCENLRAEV